MSELDELQRLALVSKVCTELDNHLGLSDRTLAEFIIHLAAQFPEPGPFREALAKNGAEFPGALCDNLLRLIKVMGGASSSGANGAAKSSAPIAMQPRVPRNETEAAFPGLAMPNVKPVELEEGFREQPETPAPEPAKAAVPAAEEPARSSDRSSGERRHRSSRSDDESSDRRDKDSDRRHRDSRSRRDGSRERESGSRRRSSRDDEHDERRRRRSSSRERDSSSSRKRSRRDSRSPEQQRQRSSGGGSEREKDRDSSSRMPSPPRRQHAADSALMAPPPSRLPAAPELYGIYEGQVSQQLVAQQYHFYSLM
jgi:ATP-dependent RNA helicase DHX8/PRP22